MKPTDSTPATAQAVALHSVVLPPSYSALRKDYKRQITREFMGGTSTRALCNKHSLTKAVVEQIIRSQMGRRQNAEVSEGGTRDSRTETAAQSRPSLH